LKFLDIFLTRTGHWDRCLYQDSPTQTGTCGRSNFNQSLKLRPKSNFRFIRRPFAIPSSYQKCHPGALPPILPPLSEPCVQPGGLACIQEWYSWHKWLGNWHIFLWKQMFWSKKLYQTKAHTWYFVMFIWSFTSIQAYNFFNFYYNPGTSFHTFFGL